MKKGDTGFRSILIVVVALALMGAVTMIFFDWEGVDERNNQPAYTERADNVTPEQTETKYTDILSTTPALYISIPDYDEPDRKNVLYHFNEETRLTKIPLDVKDLVWVSAAANGSRVAFYSKTENQLYTLEPKTGVVEQAVVASPDIDVTNITQPTIAPNGQSILFIHTGSLYSVDITSGEVTQMGINDPYNGSLTSVQFSEDGRRIAVGVQSISGQAQDSGVLLLLLNSEDQHIESQHFVSEQLSEYYAFSPNGTHIYVGKTSAILDTTSGEVTRTVVHSDEIGIKTERIDAHWLQNDEIVIGEWRSDFAELSYQLINTDRQREGFRYMFFNFSLSEEDLLNHGTSFAFIE
jgi:hypothetical protein